jgi:hypothetical protein
LYWRPTPLDIGIGYAGSYRAVATPTSERSFETDDNTLTLHGVYFSAAYAIENHRHWRTWLGGRVEGLTGSHAGRSLSVTGFAVRLASELYSAGVKGAADHRVAAFFAGAFALGVYVEGTKRFGLPAELGAVGIGAGVTMRVPFLAAVGD